MQEQVFIQKKVEAQYTVADILMIANCLGVISGGSEKLASKVAQSGRASRTCIYNLSAVKIYAAEVGAVLISRFAQFE